MQPLARTIVARPPPPVEDRRVCLFVSYAPDRTIKPHVDFHLRAIKNGGYLPILILAVDGDPEDVNVDALGCRFPLLIRANEGFDFGAWADALRLFPDIWRASSVLFTNDSVFGPFRKLRPLFDDAEAHAADIVGLTQSIRYGWHLQSYFVILKQAALQHQAVRTYWAGVANLPTLDDVIKTYEMHMANTFASEGLRVDCLFHPRGQRALPVDPTVRLWNVLLEEGFPYLKVKLFKYSGFHPLWNAYKDRLTDRKLVRMIDEHVARHIDIVDLPEAK